MKYKVGDKVKVKSGLSEGVEYCMDGELNGMYVARDMIAMGGQVVTILGENDTYYDIEEDRRIFSWADGMFEQTKKGEKNMNDATKVYPKQMLKNMGIARVLQNKQATVVWLDDGTKGVSVVSRDDERDAMVGLSVAYAYAKGTQGNKAQFKKNMEVISKKKDFVVKK